MFINDLKNKFDRMYTTFPCEGGYTSVQLMDNCNYDTNASSVNIAIEVCTVMDRQNSKQDSISLCNVPLQVSNGLVEINGIYYKFVNGLMVKNGFYLERYVSSLKNKKYDYVVSFIKQDKVIFKLEFDQKMGLCLVLSGDRKITIYEYLLSLGVASNSEDMDNKLYKHKGQLEVNQDRSKEEIAEFIYKAMFGYTDKGNYSDMLYEKTFNGFYNTAETYENKHIFFSYAKYIGCTIVECSNNRIIKGVIDIEKARQLDLLKVEKVKLLSKCNHEFEVERDYSSTFTEKDLINIIRMLINADRYSESIAECDKVALYNKELFTYVDYVAEYVYAKVKQFVNRKDSRNVFNQGFKQQVSDVSDFIDWVRNNAEKGKEPIAINNAMTYEASRDLFLKDLFRKDKDSISQKERQFHSTYFGWISPSLTSDGDKVGLTGQFVIDACDNSRIRRSFSYQLSDVENLEEENTVDTSEDGDTKENKMYLEPHQTYNKKIVFMERNGTYSVYMNGTRLENQVPSKCDLLCKVEDIKEYLSCKTPAVNSDQGKRQGLGNKAIFQALPMVGNSQKKSTVMKSEFFDKSVGITAGQILRYIFESSNRDVKDIDCDRIQVMSVVTKSNKYILEIKYGDSMLENYTHPVFIPSVAENTRLKFSVCPAPDGGSVYKLDDYVVTCGKYDDVGEDCNVLFGNFDGYTYEDGITILSDFVKRMGLVTKLYFTSKILVDGILEPQGVVLPDVDYLDKSGLPNKGTFINYGAVICAIFVDGESRVFYSEKVGYVEDIIINKSSYGKVNNIKIILSSVRQLRKGDKLSNCHGNKGVVVRIIDSSTVVMGKGPKPDIIVNPNGTIGRMNLGQLKEMLGNTISEASGKRLTFDETGVNSCTIKELTQKAIDAGGYEDVDLYYNGYKVESKVYIGKMSMYRMKQYSELHMKATSSPRLSVNQVVESGQKMSELATNVYEAFNCTDELKYMMVFQSRNASASRVLAKSVVKGEVVDTNKYSDTSKYRISAMMASMGFKMIEQGITYLTNEDIDTLPVVEDVAGALIRPTIHGEFDTGNRNGYKVAATINVGSDVIMPNILQTLITLIKFVDPTEERKPFNGNSEYLEKICTLETIEIRLSSYRDCLQYREIDKNNVQDTRYKRGYFNLVLLLQQLDMGRVLNRLSDDKSPVKYEYLKSILKSCNNENIFRLVTLDRVPVAPINLRPQYKDRSGQSIDSWYTALLRGQPSREVYKTLNIICKEFKALLFQHGESKAEGNELSHAAKKSEIRDATVARRYSYSCRSVSGFDLNLKVYQIAIPLKLLMNTLDNLIIEYINNQYQYNRSMNRTDKLFFDENGIVLTDKRSVVLRIKDAMGKIYSDTTCDPIAKTYIMEAITFLIKGKACSMVREPILRRQGNYCFEIVIGEGDTIKTNPLVCESYNLDFDGDATPEYLCMDSKVSANLIKKMNPYFGMYDLDSDKVWIKPNQDSLFGLYYLTKYKPTSDVTMTLKSEEGILERLKFEVKFCNKSLGDTIEVRQENNKSKIIDTIGNLILLYTIIKDPFHFDTISLPKILNLMHEGLTNNTISGFIRYLDESEAALEDGYIGITDDNSPLYGERSATVLDMIDRINKLGYEIITFKGTTLLPSELAKVRDKEEIISEGLNSGKIETTSIFIDDRSRVLDALKKGKPMISSVNDTINQRYVQSELVSDIEKVPYLSDLLKSGARGKISDLLNLWDGLGNIVYEGNSIKIDSNFTRGIGYIDTMITSQVVRSAKVDTQCNMGVASNAIKEKQLLASSIKFKGRVCDGEAIKLEVRYDINYKGRSLDKYEKITVEDAELLVKLNSILMCSGETVFPGSIVKRMLQKHQLRTLNGETLEFKLSKEFKSIVSPKYVIFGDKVVLGGSVLDEIQRELPTHVLMYSLYNCVEENGVCKRCYGKLDNRLNLDAVGMNTVFSIGQSTIQYTLDAAKLTGGKVNNNESIQLMSMYNYRIVSDRRPIIQEANLNIMYKDCKIIIQNIKYTGTEHIRREVVEEFELNSAYFDVNWDITKYFVPMGFPNFVEVNKHGNNQIMEQIYCNMLYEFVGSVSIRSLDLIMCMNTRYVMTEDGIKELTINTMSYPRYWLLDTEFQAQQDILINLILSDPMGKLIKNALIGKTYKKNATILSDLLGFDNVGRVTLATSEKVQKVYKDTETQLKPKATAESRLEEIISKQESRTEVVPAVEEVAVEVMQDDDDKAIDLRVETTNIFI